MIGGREVQPAAGRPSRLTMLLWGSAGTGKTTLAATAPGKKLIINFDPDGPTSISGFDNVDVADFTSPTTAEINSFKSASNPLGIADVLEEYDTFIIDSLTNVTHHTLQQGIKITNGATIERPSPAAYQVRNALALHMIKNVLAITSKSRKNVIFIAHESDPVTNDEGIVLYITLSLGGKLPEQAALDISEVWNVQDLGMGRPRRVAVRPCRNRKPMKTRLFSTSGEPEFNWVFNPDTQEGMTIASWYEQWQQTGRKIPLPSAVDNKPRDVKSKQRTA